MSIDQTLDRREAILERMLDIGQTHLPGIKSAWRNHGPAETGFQGVPRPAFLLYDGGTRLTQDLAIHKRPPMPPTIWAMDPQILIVLENRDNIDNLNLDGVSAPVGPELSQWARQVSQVVVNDDVLLDLVTSNGRLEFRAFETDMKLNRTVGAYGAWVLMLYEFYYPFFPAR